MSSNKIEISVKDIPEIIETLKEAEKEIEFERKSKNLFIDDLYKVCEISLKQDKEIERLNNIINELKHDFESYELEYLQETYQGSLADFIETELERIKELKGSDKE